MKRLFVIVVLLSSTACLNAQQHDYGSDFIQNLSGPRVGVTFLTNGDIQDKLNEEFGYNYNMISQFGYQFETQIMGDENFAGLIEGIVFIGGLEHGLFLPSLTGLFGARWGDGYEVAVGPNLSLAGAGLVIGVGRTIKAGNVNIPINLAWVPSTQRQRDEFDSTLEQYITSTYKTGHRFTLTIGFNYRNR
jgi:hypothetical protein